MTYLTAKQVELLLQRIHPKRVLARDGNSYVEGHDVKAELNRVFGFGRWSSEVVEQVLIFEEETVTKSTNKPAWYVAYRSVVKLTVCAPDGTPLATYTEGHVGDSTHPQRGEAHGNAVTNSETYALKRCAVMLGDQFGLSLYNKGSLAPIVRWTLVQPEGGATGPDVDTTDIPDVHPESEQVEDKRETNPKRPEPQPAAPPTDERAEKEKVVAALRERAIAGRGTTAVAPFYARLDIDARKAGVLKMLVEDRDGNMVTVGAFLQAEQQRARNAA